MIKTIWPVLFVAILNTAVNTAATAATAAPVVVMECKGRSWTHQILGDNKYGPFHYVQQGWGVISEFEVERLVEASAPLKFIFRNEAHVFAISADVSSGPIKRMDGREVRTGTGAMYRKDGFTNDQIRECWADPQILQPF